MITLFETEDYGKIECDSAKMEAYFFKDDYIASIDDQRCFRNVWGTMFRVFFGSSFLKSAATLEVWTPKTIGRIEL